MLIFWNCPKSLIVIFWANITVSMKSYCLLCECWITVNTYMYLPNRTRINGSRRVPSEKYIFCDLWNPRNRSFYELLSGKNISFFCILYNKQGNYLTCYSVAHYTQAVINVVLGTVYRPRSIWSVWKFVLSLVRSLQQRKNYVWILFHAEDSLVPVLILDGIFRRILDFCRQVVPLQYITDLYQIVYGGLWVYLQYCLKTVGL